MTGSIAIGAAGQDPEAGVLKIEARLAAERSAGRMGNAGLLICVPGERALRWRVPWELTKKKPNFSFTTGPPKLPPKMFCLTGGRFSPAALRKNSLAFKVSLRKNSYASP